MLLESVICEMLMQTLEALRSTKNSLHSMLVRILQIISMMKKQQLAIDANDQFLHKSADNFYIKSGYVCE